MSNSYIELLKSKKASILDDNENLSQEPISVGSLDLNEAKKEDMRPEEILRSNGYKIRMVTPTAFGTQIDFAKKYDSDEITKVLNGFNIKIKNNSVFIVE